MARFAFLTGAILAILSSAGRLSACVWDSDTLRDELEIHADLFDLITGQFPHHGPAYYEARIRRCKPLLEASPGDTVVRNDLAVAYIKLGRFDEAQAELEKIEEIKPGEYTTLSNLGVLFKKKGDFVRAAEFTKRALAIKPEGHLGLGDYYLKMLDWRASAWEPGTNKPAYPENNFLGQPYRDFVSSHRVPVETPEDFERLQALIRSDFAFPDAFLVLGDVLWDRGDLNLALWAYIRARELGHPNPAILSTRISKIFDHWIKTADQFDSPGRVVEGRIEGEARIASEIKSCGAWLEAFQKTEAELVARGGEVDFAQVEAELARRNISRHRPADVGIVRGIVPFSKLTIAVVAMIAVPLGLAIFLAVRRASRRRRVALANGTEPARS
jgi:tetratricopeptide (TPR) repeat protein